MSYLVQSAGLSGSLPRLLRGAARRSLFPLFVLGFAGAYFLAARLGIATALPPEGIVVIWPPNAVVLAALLAVPRGRWWMFFLATVGTEVAADLPDYPLWAAIGYGLVNFTEAALAAVLLQQVAKVTLPLSRVGDFVRFVLAGPLVASGAAALFGAAIYKIGNPALDYLHYWRVFWFGDAVGLLVVGTALLAWRASPGWRRIGGLQAAEAAVIAVGLLATSASAFFIDHDEPAVYLIFPFLAWAALRFGIQGASAAIVAAVTIAVSTAARGLGPFAELSSIDAVVSLQGLIAVVALSTFMLAFAVEESRRMAEKLRHEVTEHIATEQQLRETRRALEAANAELDERVRERTKELESALARNALLVDEVHHRTKNSLQIASSLLGLGSRNLSDPEARAKLASVQGQIRAMAATYDAIHQLGEADMVDVCAVLPGLCKEITRSAGGQVSLSTEMEGHCPVSSERAVALSLALNELITNAVKHAGVGNDTGISVKSRGEGGWLRLTIADNGPGFPPGFRLDQATGFGMRMAQSVVTQAKGELRIVESSAGAVIEISIPLGAEAA